MGLVMVTPPTDEPVLITYALEHLRASGGDVWYVTQLIKAAREFCEARQRRAYVTQTLEYSLDAFPVERRIELPRPKLQAVLSVTYTTEDGVATVYDPANYVVDTRSLVGSVVLKPKVAWPKGPLWPVNAVVIRYTAGYGNVEAVPQQVKQAMLLLVGHWYEHREAVLTGTISKQIEFAVTALLAQDRVTESIK